MSMLLLWLLLKAFLLFGVVVLLLVVAVLRPLLQAYRVLRRTPSEFVAMFVYRLSEVAGVVLFAAGLIWLIAYVTYKSHDPSFPTFSAAWEGLPPPENFVGRVGAFIGAFSHARLGYASYLIPAVLFVVGWQFFWVRGLTLMWCILTEMSTAWDRRSRSQWLRILTVFIPEAVWEPWYGDLREDRQRMGAAGRSRAFIELATAVQFLLLAVCGLKDLLLKMLGAWEARRAR